MFKYRHKLTPFFIPRCVRWISQFRIPMSDCVPLLPDRKVVDPAACKMRDKGLVLGVYHNDNVAIEPSILTATAERYNRQVKGKLWQLLQLAPMPRLGEVRVFYDVDDDFGYVAVAGLGSECLAYNASEKMDESKEAIRIAAAVGSRALQKLRPTHIHVESFGNAEAASEGSNLAVWQFQEYKSSREHPNLLIPRTHLYDDCDINGWNYGKLKAESQNLVRFLQEMPANILNPTEFAKIAVDLLCELDINVEVKTKGWAAHHEMGGFVALGKSSVQPPLYVEVSYYGAGLHSRPVVLVGKGVTFDSGSLDLRSVHELRHMRGDMAGAASVLAVARAAALLRLPVNIRGIMPLCEVMPNGSSPRFGDIVCSANGKSISIRQPAREGRILIADSLVYARSFWPKLLLDIGTLSPELTETFGGAACAAFGNSEEMLCHLEAAGGVTGDRVWRMPLWKFYEARIKDLDAADVGNTGKTKYGDSANCAAFLNQFVCDAQWLHLDTYNVAYTKGVDFPYLGRGMTGRPTRTIIELINQLLANSKL